MPKTPSLLAPALTALIVSVLAHAFWPHVSGGAAQRETAAKEPAFARTVDTGTLRCGYVLYPPFVNRDPNTGKLSGIFVDLTEKIGELAGWTIAWSAETSFATIVEDLKSGKYDVYCGGSWVFFPTARYWANTVPAFYSPVLIYARADDRRFDGAFDVGKLDDPAYTFAEIDGELSQTARQQDFPAAKTLQLPHLTQVSDLALSVASRKADVTLIEKGVADSYMAHNPGALKDISHGRPVRIFGNTWQMAYGETSLRHLFDNAVNEMLQTGFIEKTLRKYEKTPNTYYRAAPPYLLPSVKQP